MTIIEKQEAILRLGWQFTEHIYNDWIENNCSLKFSPSQSPHALDEGHDEYYQPIGWGRYDREYAWNMAYEYIVGEHITATMYLREHKPEYFHCDVTGDYHRWEQELDYKENNP